MYEYICKNSVYSKPCAIQLDDYSLEWQCGNNQGKIPYANIVSVLLRKQGKKFYIEIESDYQGSLIATNRFYLSNREFEDRSRQYNTFVRMLHLHLNKQKTTSFFKGTSMRTWSLLTFGSFILVSALQIGIYSLPEKLTPWATLFNIAISLVLIITCIKLYPRPYAGDNIPLAFLPPAMS